MGCSTPVGNFTIKYKVMGDFRVRASRWPRGVTRWSYTRPQATVSHPSPQAKPSNPSNPRVFFDVDIGGERGEEAGRPGSGVPEAGTLLEQGAALRWGPAAHTGTWTGPGLRAALRPWPCTGAVGRGEVSGNFCSRNAGSFWLYLSRLGRTCLPPSTVKLAQNEVILCL